MKFISAMAVACLMAVFDSGLAYAACAGNDPAAVAKAFYFKHADFHTGNPARLKGIVTPRLLAALDREHKCASGQICAIEAVPWTDAQDGEIDNPVAFKTIENTGTRAAARMDYSFVVSETRRRPQHVKLLLERSSSTECWFVADLMGPRGKSLLESIEKWHKEYGGGP